MGAVQNALLYPELIAYVAGANNYARLHFRDGQQLLLSVPLGFVEKQLPGFIRVHKTALINPRCIAALQPPSATKQPGSVTLESGVVLPVSRRRWSEFALQLEQASSKPSLSVTRSASLASLFLLFVSQDTNRQLLLEQLVADQWPQIAVVLLPGEQGIVAHLASLPVAERPTLILLDESTKKASQLRFLQEMKGHPALRRLPVVLLVGANDEGSEGAYAQQVNSVVRVPALPHLFTALMKQVCEYWFQVASLPVNTSLP